MLPARLLRGPHGAIRLGRGYRFSFLPANILLTPVGNGGGKSPRCRVFPFGGAEPLRAAAGACRIL